MLKAHILKGDCYTLFTTYTYTNSYIVFLHMITQSAIQICNSKITNQLNPALSWDSFPDHTLIALVNSNVNSY